MSGLPPTYPHPCVHINFITKIHALNCLFNPHPHLCTDVYQLASDFGGPERLHGGGTSS